MAVQEGLVTVGGRPATKSATLVGRDEAVLLVGSARRYVSRGGDKLEAALEAFDVDVLDRRCIDVGASTGGFTDCLLQAGAASVIAIDVGYGQFDWSLRTDARVMLLERTDVRDVDPGTLPHLAEVLVADLAFISLRTVMPALADLARPRARVVLLVKPQFEAGRGAVDRKGVVRDPHVWRRVVEDVAESARMRGIGCTGIRVSPLVGPAGNVEFLFAGTRDDAEARREPGAMPGLVAALESAETLGQVL